MGNIIRSKSKAMPQYHQHEFRCSKPHQGGLFQMPRLRLNSRPSYLAENAALSATAKAEETPAG